MSIIKKVFLLFLVFSISASTVAAEDKWYLSFYTGQSNHKKYIDYYKFKSAPENSYIYVLGAGTQIYRLTKHLTIDAEALLGQHSGKQTNQEFAFALLLRSRFNLTDNVNLGITFGDGLSYASTTPKIETDNSEDTSRLLNLLLTEITIGIPKSKIDVFFRIHHRSGIFGLVNGIEKGGSNFHCLGVRYFF
ncbi:MAG: hypothetical protein N2738_04435 [Thermodesulfovibrionales bacterium]|nr:hypothetical protein [Thermodesulfovibrionales bacterium]